MKRPVSTYPYQLMETRPGPLDEPAFNDNALWPSLGSSRGSSSSEVIFLLWTARPIIVICVVIEGRGKKERRITDYGSQIPMSESADQTDYIDQAD